MTKSVSKVLTTSTVVAVAATAINQAEALNDRPQQNRLRVLQEEGEDASTSTSLSMPTNVESITNLIEEEEPKFQEKKELDLGILVSSVMKNGEFAETVSQAFDEMGDWDKQDLVENVDELVGLVKHLLLGSKSLANQSLERVKTGSSKSGKGSKASLDDGTCSYYGTTIGPFNDVSRYTGYGSCCEDSDCLGNAGGTYCGEYKVCYCENAYTYNGQAGDGDCCYYNEDCASNNCVYTGPGRYDDFCAPTTDDD